MNIFEKVLVDSGKVIEWPFQHASTLVEVLTTSLKDEPAVKSAVIGLIKQIETVSADGAIAVTADGLNLPDDMAEIVAAQTLFSYVKNIFLPAVSKAYSDLSASLPGNTAPVAAAQAPDANSLLSPGPGLHSITNA